MRHGRQFVNHGCVCVYVCVCVRAASTALQEARKMSEDEAQPSTVSMRIMDVCVCVQLPQLCGKRGKCRKMRHSRQYVNHGCVCAASTALQEARIKATEQEQTLYSESDSERRFHRFARDKDQGRGGTDAGSLKEISRGVCVLFYSSAEE